MVQLKGLLCWTLIACIMLCCCHCGPTEVVNKIPHKKLIWAKDRYQKVKVEQSKIITDSAKQLFNENDALHKNTSQSSNQKSLKYVESTTNVALSLMPTENKFPLENDFTSTTVIDNEDATTTSLTSSSTTVSSCDSSLPPATILQSDATTITSSGENATAYDVGESEELIPCTCGIFLSSQIKKGSHDAPIGEAVISNSLSRTFSCDGVGQKHCQTKCLEQIVQHLPNSAKILCASLDRDIRKERAYLFIKNCSNKWINTNLAAGREYCCKNREPCKTR